MNDMNQDVDVSIRDLTKQYGDFTAVDSLDLDVRSGEFLTLLGPSGCGKTTTLNMIAGFIIPDGGSIDLGGKDVTKLPPNLRDSAMVFQQYALFPHMTVAENVGFGLRMRKVPSADRTRRVAEALETVGLAERGDRYPKQLSGGQQQRVALARAIAVRPKVLLLDEPLSNLDLKLREQLRLELLHLQREVGITTVFVTHDQTEALVMSDRVAVMKGGRIEQLGKPVELYERPANRFVAGFIGQSNIVRAHVLPDDGSSPADGQRVQLASGHVLSAARSPHAHGTEVELLMRPESIRLGPPTASGQSNRFRGICKEVVYQGSQVDILADLEGVGDIHMITAHARAADVPRTAEIFECSVDSQDCYIIPSAVAQP